MNAKSKPPGSNKEGFISKHFNRNYFFLEDFMHKKTLPLQRNNHNSSRPTKRNNEIQIIDLKRRETIKKVR